MIKIFKPRKSFIQFIISIDSWKFQYLEMGSLFMRLSALLAIRIRLLVFILTVPSVKTTNYVRILIIKVKNAILNVRKLTRIQGTIGQIIKWKCCSNLWLIVKKSTNVLLAKYKSYKNAICARIAITFSFAKNVSKKKIPLKVYTQITIRNTTFTPKYFDFSHPILPQNTNIIN